jgi:hypothetical protein
VNSLVPIQGNHHDHCRRVQIAGFNAKRVSIASVIKAATVLGREIAMELPGVVFSQAAVLAGDDLSKAATPPVGLSAA